jgi:osmotically-inducible protein OsmY
MGSSGMQSQQRQSFRGKGPKGYERSDERLKEIVCEKLTDDDDIDASSVNVEVRNGEVTLTGTVDDRRVKFQIEDLVERCGGVKEIHNNLRVSSQHQGQYGTETGESRSDQAAGKSSKQQRSGSGASSGSTGT